MSSNAESVNDPASGPEPPLLDVRDLRVRFRMLDGTIFAVNGISLHLDRGETLGLVGESGSGKSVTSLALMRLLPPEPAAEIGGEIEFDGRDIANLSEKQMRPLRGRDIAMVFQDPMTSLNPVLRIGEQVEETIKAHREIDTAGARARATELLRLVGIADPERQLERYPHEFSGGMRQRVMIAMALALEPKLLIADEPTTALDVTIQAQVLELLQKLTLETGTALILITHDLGVVARMTRRVAVMYAGLVVESASTGELFADPRHPYTVGLLHSIPRLDGDVGTLRPIEGSPPDLRQEPAGCPFAPRCAWRLDTCWSQMPELLALEPDLGRRRRARRRVPQPRDPRGGRARTPRPSRLRTRSAAPGRRVTSNPPLLQLRDVRVHFPITKGLLLRRVTGEVRAVDGVDLNVTRGQSVGLVGESGSGKTTLGRAVVGLARPTLRHRRVRRRGRLVAGSRRAETAPAARADGVPGSVRVARSQDDGRQEHRRAARDPPPRLARGSDEQGRQAPRDRGSASDATPTVTRTSCRVASANASAWPGRCRWIRTSSSRTNR